MFGLLMGIGAGLGLLSSYMGYRNSAAAARQQGQNAMMTAQLQAQQYRMMSAMQMQQAGAFGAQSAALMRQSAAFMDQAAITAKTGEILQSNQLVRAAQAQEEAEHQTRRTAEIRRQLVGTAKVQFAANGVLLESRPQSSVAMWEQDEAADLAYEMHGIKKQVDNEVWGYVTQGSQDRLQSLFNAASLGLQAQSSQIEAGTAGINAASAAAQARISSVNAQTAILSGQAARDQANAAAQASFWNFLGNVGSLGMAAGAYGASRGAVSPAASGGGSVNYPGITNTQQSPLVHTYGR